MKVGTNLEDDKRRCKLIRDCIGYDKQLVSWCYVGNALLALSV